jgi:hypothetical protein
MPYEVKVLDILDIELESSSAATAWRWTTSAGTPRPRAPRDHNTVGQTPEMGLGAGRFWV